MQVDFTPTAADYIATNRYHADHSPAGRWLFRRGLIMAPVLLLVLGVMLMSEDQNGNPAWRDVDTWLAVLPGLLLPVLFVLFRKPLGGLFIRWMLRWRNNAKLLEPRRVELMPEGLVQTMRFMSTTILWPGIIRIASTPDHVLFYVLSAQAFAVPRRAFASDEEFHEFVALAQRYHEHAMEAPASSPVGQA